MRNGRITTPFKNEELRAGRYRQLNRRPHAKSFLIDEIGLAEREAVALLSAGRTLDTIVGQVGDSLQIAGAKREVLDLIKALKAEGVAIVLLSTEPETVIAESDRILVMSKGRITKEFAGERVSKDVLMNYA